MAIALPGLASGLDSAAIIAATMDVERLPKLSLETKAASASNYVSVLKTLNGKVSDLLTAAQDQTKPDAFSLFTTTSSSPSVTVTVGSSAAAGELDITVTSVAARHSAVTAPMTDWGQNPPVLTFATAAEEVTVTADSDSLDDVVKAVNASDAGVTATKVSAGNGEFRLQFTAKETGAENAFELKDSSGAAVPTTLIRQGSDASITLFAGTDAEQNITSSANTFKDVMAGVDITVSGVSAEPVSIAVSRDADAVASQASKLVDRVNDVFGYIKLKTSVSQTTDATGKSTVKAGDLTSDSLTRTVTQQVLTAAMDPVNGMSPSTIGISLTRDGLLAFDQAKFTAALAEDPQGTEAMLAAIAGRLADASTSISDKYDGSLSQKINGQDTVLRNLNDQIAGWDTRLAKREESLALLYARLEVSMSRLNSMMTGLASSLDNLPTWGNEKK